MKNAKQDPAVLSAHCRKYIYLPNVKIMDTSINILYFKFDLENSGFVYTPTVILFVKLERPSEISEGRKLRQHIIRQSNTVSNF